MRSIFGVLPFVALTFLCWGNYGPLMHHGTVEMQGARLTPFIFVGLAYFLIAVVVPMFMLQSKGEKGEWTMTGTIWSLIAGAVGAVGALGIILAFSFRGNPIYVMPLVFGLAPVVNTFVTMFMARTYKEAGPIFYAGVIAAAVGAAGVLFFKPSGHTGGGEILDLTIRDVLVIAASIALTALCWGSYGPTLHKGQMLMQGSRLRPFLCVGLAYFAIAVALPIVLLSTVWHESGSWTVMGTFWSLGAGAAGALGALGVIMAFNFGGKPIFVMPLVFGMAPVVNTFTSILETYLKTGALGQVSVLFWISLAMVIAGAVTVLVFAPRHGPPSIAAKGKDKAAKEKAKPAEAKPAESKPAREVVAKDEKSGQAKAAAEK